MTPPTARTVKGNASNKTNGNNIYAAAVAKSKSNNHRSSAVGGSSNGNNGNGSQQSIRSAKEPSGNDDGDGGMRGRTSSRREASYSDKKLAGEAEASQEQAPGEAWRGQPE